MTIHEQDIAYEARKEGKQEAQIETAKKMLKEKLPLEIISKITNFSIEQIQNLCEMQ